MIIVEETFNINSNRRSEMIDITDKICSAVNKSGVTNGDVIVYCPHTTAGITINENADPSVIHDVLLTLKELIPTHQQNYHHSEGNSDAHVKSSLVGCSEQVPISNKSLNLGTWQGIFFCEFDGPRSRKILVQVRGH